MMHQQRVPLKRKTRKQKVAERLETLKHKKIKINWNDILLNIFYLTGIVLIVLEIDIYRKTIIDWRIPFIIWLITGLFLAPLINKLLPKNYKKIKFYLPTLFNLAFWGSLLMYSFMSINYYFPKGEENNMTVHILESGHNRGKSCYTYAYVNIESRKKKLVFPCSLEIENYTDIDIAIKKGFFGFDIIEYKKPVVK